jgi:hypothetical protein
MPGRLFVFLHGVTVSSPRGNDLRIVLPLIPGHVQKAGAWLWETEIARDSVLRLKGVNQGNRTFLPTDPIIFLPNVGVTGRKRAATIWLPLPEDILCLLLAAPWPPTPSNPNPPNFVARTKDPVPTIFGALSSVQILVYSFIDENEVVLEGHRWEPCATGGAISLHIVSTSEEPEGKEHEDETEDVMHEVLRDYPGLEFSTPRPLAAPWFDPAHPNYGSLGVLSQLHHQGEYFLTGANEFAFAKAELEHPTSRALRISRLGRLKQGKRLIEPLWYDPDFLGERPCNCVSVATP